MPLAIAVAIFCRKAVVPSSFSSFGLVINEVSTSTDGMDGDFSTTNAACSVLRLCSLCTGLIFSGYASPASGCFDGVGLHQIEQYLLQQMVFIRRFLTGDLIGAVFAIGEVFRHGATGAAV